MYAEQRRRTPSMDGSAPPPGSNNHQSPAPPPGHPHAYSPAPGHARTGSATYSGVPPSPNHFQRGGPGSPSATRPLHPAASPSTRDKPATGYYDPTSEARATNVVYPAHSPVQGRPPFEQFAPPPPPPAQPHFANGHGPVMQTSPPHGHPGLGAPPYDDAARQGPPPPQNLGSSPPKRSNPMSMMNLLSESSPTEAPAPPPPVAKQITPQAVEPVQASVQPPVPAPVAAPAPAPAPAAAPRTPASPPQIRAKVKKEASKPKSKNGSPSGFAPLSADHLKMAGPPGLNKRDTEAAWAEIEAADESDVEADIPGWSTLKTEYAQRVHKRSLEAEINESKNRKRRRTSLMKKYHDHFNAAAEAERLAYLEQHENEVAEEVRLKEIEEDKERKKDQQRKRRREKAIADEQVKRDEALQLLTTVEDEEEKAKIQKDIQRHDKKIRDTQNRLQGIVPVKEKDRNESPHTAGKRETLDGMSSFFTHGNEDGTPDPAPTSGRGRGRGGRGGGGGRQRKSKEQKQAEKDSAARAQAAIDQGQDLPNLAPKDEERLLTLAEKRAARDGSEGLSDTDIAVQPMSGLTGMARFESKGYNQIYEQITRDIAKGVPKVARIKNNSLDTKQSNARKTAQLAAKEARRWQARTNKSTKDVAARAKRAMREMLGFWKRNERDEREGRKVAEKQELDKAKRAEAEREANRQKRKLNFLISQTELYSHFIGKKVKTDEIEKHGEGGEAAAHDPNAENDDMDGKIGSKVTNFEDLDFDAEDDEALKEAARANAQHAVQEAKNRAQAFDRAGNELSDAQENFDDGEMNFQNPTSLQSMDIEQPKLLNCQLKEYQIKGLNWLVNLYEQGINGILADEMGLGKTVQSISVMAYLAEVHNIWGPFLVIAPASTLHNWQQEIARFVPDIKVLPYWGSARDRKVLRKYWDRKHITYTRDSPFHVLVTSYQLVVQDTAYFQKVKWQYMILDEAQAIKSSNSSRWKSLLGFHCRNRLLLTGTPIQNNMQELWALLHFIMPSLFDSHDEFSEWFSKDIENHAQSNSKLNEDQLRRLHMILKPFMLRRIKKHVQKELGDKIEKDVYCDLTYRQRAYYTNLRNKISILDLIEKAATGDDQDTATLMNLVMQFRKVCNHPDLFERAAVRSPMSMSYFAETASFMREGQNVNVAYTARSMIEFWLPRMLMEDGGALNVAGPENSKAGWKSQAFKTHLNIWDEEHIRGSEKEQGAFSWLRFVDQSATDIKTAAHRTWLERAVALAHDDGRPGKLKVAYDDDSEQENAGYTPVHSMLNIVQRNDRKPLAEVTDQGILNSLLNISSKRISEEGYGVIESCYLPAASAPPVELICPSYRSFVDVEDTFFNIPMRRALYPINAPTETALLRSKLPPSKFPVTNMLPAPASQKQRYTKIQVPSMRRFVTDSGKLACLDRLLRELKEGGHRVLLYFQMTRMIDLMEEYLTYRNYKYCRLDGSTKLEDRRDTVAAFQSSPDLFVFLLSTRAGGLGINLTSADTVIFYDSDWNPTIDSQAMDRAHRLGQTRQVTVYRLITRGTIEERIRKRALQKEEVQRVVISGQAGSGVDFNSRSNREGNRTKEMALWLADDDEAEAIERREMEVMEEEAKAGPKGKKRKAPAASGKKREVSMDDMYHEGEGRFDDQSHEPSGAATPMSSADTGPAEKKRKGMSKKAKTVKQRLAVIDGEVG